MSDSKRVVIVPRWAGSARTDWYHWLARRIGADARVEVSELDVPSAPTIEGSVAALSETLGSDRSRTLLVGHSVGCQVVLRWLAANGGQAPVVPAAFLVAGWWAVESPWPELRPWVDTPIDAATARRAVRHVEVLISDDDPFMPDWKTGRARFQTELGAQVHVQPGGRHFNSGAEPVVLEHVQRLLATLP